MSVVSLVILLVNVVYVLVEEEEEGEGVVAVVQDIGEVQVMAGGAIVHVVDLHLHVVVAPHLVEEATAGHHLLTVLVRSCLMLMEMVSGSDAGAGADLGCLL